MQHFIRSPHPGQLAIFAELYSRPGKAGLALVHGHAGKPLPALFAAQQMREARDLMHNQ